MHHRPAAQWMFAGNVLMFLALLIMLGTGFVPRQAAVLTVERLNIVDSTGAPALVLANGARLPGGTSGGREYPPSFSGRGRSAGMIFYNEVGDEIGGLIYEGAPGLAVPDVRPSLVRSVEAEPGGGRAVCGRRHVPRRGSDCPWIRSGPRASSSWTVWEARPPCILEERESSPHGE